jgi:putative oxidoreductase
LIVFLVTSSVPITNILKKEGIMNMVRRIEHWGDLHHPKWLDIIRIVLGMIIFTKGIIFISSTNVQQDWIFHNSTFDFSGLLAVVLIHIVAFAHVIGGMLIIAGLLTRLSVVIQMPIVLGAMFFVNITKGLTFVNTELWLSVIVFIMLVVIWIAGSGTFSADHWIRESNAYRHKHTEE